MKDSTYAQPLPRDLHPRASQGHLANGKKVVEGWNVYPEMAAAGLWTTPADLAKVIIGVGKCVLGKKFILSSTMCKGILTEQKKPSGLGPMVEHTVDGTAFFHGGMDHGFVAKWYGRVSLDKKRIQGLVIMTNSYNSLPLLNEFMASVADAYDWPDYRPIIKTKVTIEESDLKKFAGFYKSVSDSKDQVEFRQEGQKLLCQWTGYKTCRILP